MISIWNNEIPCFDSEKRQFPATLCDFLLPGKNNPCCLILPGGGYSKKAWDHEGIEIAEWLNKIGISALVLDYRISPYGGDAYVADAQQAIRQIRSRAEEFGIDPNRLGICGFSAGGHLAGYCATMYDDPALRPDFAILCYAVLSLKQGETHEGTARNFLRTYGDTEENRKLHSPVQHVTNDCPPMFLWTTAGDKTVPPMPNTFAMHEACRKAGVPARMEYYDHGSHGLGIPKNDPVIASWTVACEEWLKELKIID